MKQAKFEVITKDGRALVWAFEEREQAPNDYGNKRYISYVMPSGDYGLIDCRYIEYDFFKNCVDFLLNWYGENLAELSEAE